MDRTFDDSGDMQWRPLVKSALWFLVYFAGNFVGLVFTACFVMATFEFVDWWGAISTGLQNGALAADLSFAFGKLMHAGGYSVLFFIYAISGFASPHLAWRFAKFWKGE